MLVYGSSFTFELEGGPQKIIECVARWAGSRANRSSVDPVILSQGIRELRLKDNSVLTFRVTPDDGNRPTYPYYFCAQLSHGDNQVPGRRWMTEIGMRQDSEATPILCTVLLKTDEVSARVNAPIQVTRPKVVEQLWCSYFFWGEQTNELCVMWWSNLKRHNDRLSKVKRQLT